MGVTPRANHPYFQGMIKTALTQFLHNVSFSFHFQSYRESNPSTKVVFQGAFHTVVKVMNAPKCLALVCKVKREIKSDRNFHGTNLFAVSEATKLYS